MKASQMCFIPCLFLIHNFGFSEFIKPQNRHHLGKVEACYII